MRSMVPIGLPINDADESACHGGDTCLRSGGHASFREILGRLHSTQARLLWDAHREPTLILAPFTKSSGQLLVLVGCLVTAGTLVGSLLPNVLQDMAPAKLRGRVFAIYAVLMTPTSGLSVVAVGDLSDRLHMARETCSLR